MTPVCVRRGHAAHRRQQQARRPAAASSGRALEALRQRLAVQELHHQVDRVAVARRRRRCRRRSGGRCGRRRAPRARSAARARSSDGELGQHPLERDALAADHVRGASTPRPCRPGRAAPRCGTCRRSPDRSSATGRAIRRAVRARPDAATTRPPSRRSRRLQAVTRSAVASRSSRALGAEPRVPSGATLSRRRQAKKTVPARAFRSHVRASHRGQAEVNAERSIDQALRIRGYAASARHDSRAILFVLVAAPVDCYH